MRPSEVKFQTKGFENKGKLYGKSKMNINLLAQQPHLSGLEWVLDPECLHTICMDP